MISPETVMIVCRMLRWLPVLVLAGLLCGCSVRTGRVLGTIWYKEEKVHGYTMQLYQPGHQDVFVERSLDDGRYAFANLPVGTYEVRLVLDSNRAKWEREARQKLAINRREAPGSSAARKAEQEVGEMFQPPTPLPPDATSGFRLAVHEGEQTHDFHLPVLGPEAQ